MPIIAKNMIVANQKVEEKIQQIVEEKVEEKVEQTAKIKSVKIRSPKPSQPSDDIPLKPLEEVSMVPKMHYDKNRHGVVIVDGKEKKISKQSQYILDMLTIDND